jgi:hypothetical protein
MAYTLITGTLIFLVALWVAQAGHTVAAAVLFFLIELFPVYCVVQYTIDYVGERAVGWVSVFAFFDIFVATGLGFAGVWQGIYLLDASQFLLGATGLNQYRIYVAFLFGSFGLLGTVGFAVVIPSGIFSELWGVFGVLQSVWYLTMLFGGGIKTRIELEKSRHSKI